MQAPLLCYQAGVLAPGLGVAVDDAGARRRCWRTETALADCVEEKGGGAEKDHRGSELGRGNGRSRSSMGKRQLAG